MIKIIRCGHDSRHINPIDIIHENGIDHYLLLLIKSDAYVEVDHKIVDVKPGSIILYHPFMHIHYGCHTAGYNDDWIHFSLTGSYQRLLAHFPFGIPVYPEAFFELSQYLPLLVNECYSDSPNSLEIKNALMEAFLRKLSDTGISSSEKPVNRYSELLNAIRKEILNSPGQNWNINAISEKCHISSSYFQHLYKEEFGISFRKDIIMARLDNSKFYLNETEMSISAIADMKMKVII